MPHPAPIHDHNRGCPDHPLRAKMPLIRRMIEHKLYGNEMRGDEILYRRLRIRHGIQCNAARSVFTAKVGQNKLARAAGEIQGV